MKPEGRRARWSMYSLTAAALAASLAVLGAGLRGSLAQGGGQGSPSNPAASASVSAPLPGLRLDDIHAVGAPFVVDNLAVFPIYTSVEEDIGEFTTLEAALEQKTAVVHEVEPSEAAANSDNNDEIGSMGNASANHHAYRGDGAEVNRLVIENKGKVAILVLAGTVVKGGKQDRQIGEDFVVAAGKTVPVDAFCVEHGRWSADRDGVATGGKFEAVKSLATTKVRAAGQYEQNQSGVWAEVNAVNAANKKSAASDTLMATLDDKEIASKRSTMTAKSTAFFAGAPQSERVVGMAYAVSGKVRAVRWFMNHKLFAMNRDTLVSTAAVEALSEPPSDGAKALPANPGPTAVASFISEIQAASVKEKRAKDGNVNEYRASDKGYGSSALVQPAPAAKPKAVTVDFASK